MSEKNTSPSEQGEVAESLNRTRFWVDHDLLGKTLTIANSTGKITISEVEAIQLAKIIEASTIKPKRHDVVDFSISGDVL